MKPIGIYIHVPFCKKKCPYCDFYSVLPNQDLIDLYTESVCREIYFRSKLQKKPVDSIYFGGGTPSLIGLTNLCKIIETIFRNFTVALPEITIELNPSCCDGLDFSKLKEFGVNRLSVGMQSIKDTELKILERNHTVCDVEKTIYAARSCGIENLSLDTMIAIPKQNKYSLEESLKFCIRNEIPHISVYLLKIEKRTKFFKIKNLLSLPDENEESELYLFTDEFLSNFGYDHYEISNFCKKGMESRHNLKYWNCDEYLGFGPSAHSFIDGKRYFYKRSIDRFIKNSALIPDGEGGTKEEYALMRLRLSSGLTNEEYKKRFGENIPEVFYKRAKEYEKCGLVSTSENQIKLTPRGFLVSNFLISKIIT